MGAGSHAEFDQYLAVAFAGFGCNFPIPSLLRQPALAVGAGSHVVFDHYLTITSLRRDLPLRPTLWREARLSRLSLRPCQC